MENLVADKCFPSPNQLLHVVGMCLYTYCISLVWCTILFQRTSIKNLVIGAFPLKIYFIIIITITNYANVLLELATHLFCKLGIDFMALDTNLLKSPLKLKSLDLPPDPGISCEAIDSVCIPLLEYYFVHTFTCISSKSHHWDLNLFLFGRVHFGFLYGRFHIFIDFQNVQLLVPIHQFSTIWYV